MSSKYQIIIDCEGYMDSTYLNPTKTGTEIFKDDVFQLQAHMLHGDSFKKPYWVTGVKVQPRELQ